MVKPIRYQPFQFYVANKGVSDPQINHLELISELEKLSGQDLVMFVRAYLQERTPAAFAREPLLWEAMREWLASRLTVHPRQIGLSGSAQMGFSLKPSRPGGAFDPHSSDLDIFVVSDSYFSVLEKEARYFIARNTTKSDFIEQAKTAERQLRMGYIDLNQVPAKHELFPKISTARNDISVMIDRLKLHGFSLKPSHLRVYKTWSELGEWVSRSFSNFGTTPR